MSTTDHQGGAYADSVIHPPGWYPDPWFGGGVRYWDGTDWTTFAAVPVPPAPPPKPPHPTLPFSVFIGSVLVILIPIVVSKYVTYQLAEFGLPIAVMVAISAVVGYGPGLLYWRHISETYGTGGMRATVGLYFRRADWWMGPVTWLACNAARIAVAIIIAATKIPITSNVEARGEGDVNRAAVAAVLIAAVLVAPFVEEIIFRGLMLRGLLSRMSWIPAVLIQGVLFGCAHYDPEFGAGNIGLIMVLASAGIVLGGAAHMQRRLGPSIIAHALINAVAMIVVLTGWTP